MENLGLEHEVTQQTASEHSSGDELIKKVLIGLALAGLGYVVAKSVPDLMRYWKISRM